MNSKDGVHLHYQTDKDYKPAHGDVTNKSKSNNYINKHTSFKIDKSDSGENGQDYVPGTRHIRESPHHYKINNKQKRLLSHELSDNSTTLDRIVTQPNRKYYESMIETNETRYNTEIDCIELNKEEISKLSNIDMIVKDMETNRENL